MHYVVSDIHGCYGLWRAMLGRIGLRDEDTLYVLGDVIDRGPDGIEILMEMSEMQNVVPFWGNHELMGIGLMKELCMTRRQKLLMSRRERTALNAAYVNWQVNGGMVTYQMFQKLPRVEQRLLLDYFQQFRNYVMVTVGQEKYFLIHSVPEDFSSLEDIGKIPLLELLFGRPDYRKRYFEDMTLVTGHTPTALIPGGEMGHIYRSPGHIAIDCGAVWGGILGAVCLETGEEIYVSADSPREGKESEEKNENFA